MIDRARDGVVTDYLHTCTPAHLHSGWWPTFNLADTPIVVGAIAFVMASAWTGD